MRSPTTCREGSFWRAETVYRSGNSRTNLQGPSSSPRLFRQRHASSVTRSRGTFDADAPNAIHSQPLRMTALRRDQLPQDERKDAPVHVVVDFDRRIDPHDQVDVLRRAVFSPDGQLHLLPWAEAAADAPAKQIDVERLRAVEAEGLRVRPLFELQREDAHADEIRTVDALEALRDDCSHAEGLRALRAPAAGRP